jgi:hypothetical protein
LIAVPDPAHCFPAGYWKDILAPGPKPIMRVRLTTLLALASPLLLMVAAAYVQWGMAGLPVVSPGPMITFETPTEPYGFPA